MPRIVIIFRAIVENLLMRESAGALINRSEDDFIPVASCEC